MALLYSLRLRRTLSALSSTPFLFHNLATSTTSTNLRSKPCRSTTTALFSSSFSTIINNNKEFGPDMAAMSGIHHEFEIALCGSKYPESNSLWKKLEWYSIKVSLPDPECAASSEEEVEEIENITRHKMPLRPFSVVRAEYMCKQHAVIGSHLYSPTGLNPNHMPLFSKGRPNIQAYVKPRRFDLNCRDAGWKSLPRMNFPVRLDPPSVTLDGKFYVMGHFGLSKLSEMPEEALTKGHGWMEVYDPILNAWEPLPNPPSAAGFVTYDPLCLHAALPSRKQILVAQSTIHEWKNCVSATFYIYNVITRSWTTLVPKRKFKLKTEYLDWPDRRPVVVDNTLYWTMFPNGQIVILAYNIDTEKWFYGAVDCNYSRPIFWNHEYMSHYEYEKSSPLLHLADQKFCLLLPSTLDKKKDHEANFNGYLTCVILDVSPILDEGKRDDHQDNHGHDDDDLNNHYDEILRLTISNHDHDDDDVNNRYNELLRLSISILSVQKYPLVRPTMLLDNVLLNG